jgi:hypothetical protein
VLEELLLRGTLLLVTFVFQLDFKLLAFTIGLFIFFDKIFIHASFRYLLCIAFFHKNNAIFVGSHQLNAIQSVKLNALFPAHLLCDFANSSANILHACVFLFISLIFVNQNSFALLNCHSLKSFCKLALLNASFHTLSNIVYLKFCA